MTFFGCLLIFITNLSGGQETSFTSHLRLRGLCPASNETNSQTSVRAYTTLHWQRKLLLPRDTQPNQTNDARAQVNCGPAATVIPIPTESQNGVDPRAEHSALQPQTSSRLQNESGLHTMLLIERGACMCSAARLFQPAGATGARVRRFTTA
eukprot:5874239-Pleurochrysis_carterae.AAC.1